MSLAKRIFMKECIERWDEIINIFTEVMTKHLQGEHNGKGLGFREEILSVPLIDQAILPTSKR